MRGGCVSAGKPGRGVGDREGAGSGAEGAGGGAGAGAGRGAAMTGGAPGTAASSNDTSAGRSTPCAFTSRRSSGAYQRYRLGSDRITLTFPQGWGESFMSIRKALNVPAATCTSSKRSTFQTKSVRAPEGHA